MSTRVKLRVYKTSKALVCDSEEKLGGRGDGIMILFEQLEGQQEDIFSYLSEILQMTTLISL